MLHDVIDSPGAVEEADLLAAHASQLAAVCKAVGVETVVDAAEIESPTANAIEAEDLEAVADLELATAAAILSVQPDTPSAATIAEDAREALLFGMTAGVLNVDVLAAEMGGTVEPREVQAMLEGRLPMTLGQYVSLQHHIGRRTA